MSVAFGRLIEIFLAYIFVFYILYYLEIPIASHLWLILGVGLWLTMGHIIKRKLKYQGVLASWYAPLTRIDERILGYFLFLLTTLSVYSSSIIIITNILYPVIIYTLILLILNSTIKSKRIKPYFNFIIIFSSIQVYFIFKYILYLLEDNIYANNIIYQLILFSLIYLTSYINYYFLRNFSFYQKLITDYEHKLTYKQKLNIAVHEASHLLMYVYFREVPHNIQLLLFENARMMNPDAHGIVIAKIPTYNTKTFLEWRMMLAISGIRGELMVFNNHSHGSESDFEQWRSLAHTYLMNFDSTYTPQPTTARQMNRNKELEAEIYNKQINIIDKYLKQNKRILLKISKHALVYNKLSYLQIYPYFSDIKKIKELPRE